MGVRILNANPNGVCLYCSTSMWVFGPMMDSEDEAEAFLEFLGEDARKFSDKELETKYYEFRKDVWDVKQV